MFGLFATGFTLARVLFGPFLVATRVQHLLLQLWQLKATFSELLDIIALTWICLAENDSLFGVKRYVTLHDLFLLKIRVLGNEFAFDLRLLVFSFRL